MLYLQPSIQAFQSFLQDLKLSVFPSFHVVLGSGFQAGIPNEPEKLGWKLMGTLPFSDVPGLPSTTVVGHSGAFSVYQSQEGSASFILQRGRIHGYEGHEPRLVVAPVMISRICGVMNFLLTNAAGALDKNMRPGDAMIITDQVNLTAKNPLAGKNPEYPAGRALGPRFADLATLYDFELSALLSKMLDHQKVRVHRGTYLGLLGPSFETPAEVRLFASWGLQAVGMSTVWEAISLKHSGARVCGLSLLSNMGVGLSDEPVNHEAVNEICAKSAPQILRAIFSLVKGLNE